MVEYNITVNSVTLTEIFDVNYDQGEVQSLGSATVICGNNSNNRAISSGETITIEKNGEIDFTGYITGKPTKAGANATEIEIQASDKRLELKERQVKRLFYEKDTGQIIRSMVNTSSTSFDLEREVGRFIFQGDSESGWDTNIPRFSLGDIVTTTLQEKGSNFLFFGWPEGSGQKIYSATYNNVPSDTLVGDGQIDTFFTRFAINNNGGIFNAEVDLRDNYGNNYIWPLELKESGFREYELKAENATPNANLGEKITSNGTLQYRFKIDGNLPDSRGLAIDYASTIPFKTESRDTDLDTSGVNDSGNIITRRIDRPIFQAIMEFSLEDGFISYIDSGNVLHYEPAGQNEGKSINFNETLVVDAEFDRDYENITNKVTVKGDGDISVTVPAPDSIEFYGVSPREKPIVDESIQTEDEAIRRAEGFLKKNSWDSEAFSFVIGDTSYQTLSVGDEVFVNWPPENISGTFQVSNSSTDKYGLVTIDITRRGTQ